MVALPFPVKPLWATPQIYPEVCFHGDLECCQTDDEDLPSQELSSGMANKRPKELKVGPTGGGLGER